MLPSERFAKPLPTTQETSRRRERLLSVRQAQATELLEILTVLAEITLRPGDGRLRVADLAVIMGITAALVARLKRMLVEDGRLVPERVFGRTEWHVSSDVPIVSDDLRKKHDAWIAMINDAREQRERSAWNESTRRFARELPEATIEQLATLRTLFASGDRLKAVIVQRIDLHDIDVLSSCASSTRYEVVEEVEISRAELLTYIAYCYPNMSWRPTFWIEDDGTLVLVCEEIWRAIARQRAN